MAPIPKQIYGLWIRHEIATGAFWRDAAVELLATFLFVAAQLALVQRWHPAAGPDFVVVQAAIGAAFVWGAVGYALGDYGGANRNPAITLALVIRAEITVMRGLLYCTMQICGAIFAAFFIYSITPMDIRGNLGATNLASNVKDWQGVLIELWITTILCLTYLATRNHHRKMIVLSALPVAFAIGSGTFIALPSTGASMNPARSVGPIVVYNVLQDNTDLWQHHWIYWVGPMGGGVLAAILFWIFEIGDKVDRKSKSHSQPAFYKDRCVFTVNDHPLNKHRRSGGTDNTGFDLERERIDI